MPLHYHVMYKLLFFLINDFYALSNVCKLLCGLIKKSSANSSCDQNWLQRSLSLAASIM